MIAKAKELLTITVVCGILMVALVGVGPGLLPDPFPALLALGLVLLWGWGVWSTVRGPKTAGSTGGCPRAAFRGIETPKVRKAARNELGGKRWDVLCETSGLQKAYGQDKDGNPIMYRAAVESITETPRGLLLTIRPHRGGTVEDVIKAAPRVAPSLAAGDLSMTIEAEKVDDARATWLLVARDPLAGTRAADVVEAPDGWVQ